MSAPSEDGADLRSKRRPSRRSTGQRRGDLARAERRPLARYRGGFGSVGASRDQSAPDDQLAPRPTRAGSTPRASRGRRTAPTRRSGEVGVPARPRPFAAEHHELVAAEDCGARGLRHRSEVLPRILLEVELENRGRRGPGCDGIDLARERDSLRRVVRRGDRGDRPPRVRRRVVRSSADRIPFGPAPAEDDELMTGPGAGRGLLAADGSARERSPGVRRRFVRGAVVRHVAAAAAAPADQLVARPDGDSVPRRRVRQAAPLFFVGSYASRLQPQTSISEPVQTASRRQ